MKFKKLLLFITACAMAVTSLAGTLTASAVSDGKLVDSGRVGENVTYKIYKNGDDAVLIISGTGPMYEKMPEDGWEWDNDSKLVWWDTSGIYTLPIRRVKEVIIEEGVTTVGERAFFTAAYNVEKVTIPSTLVKIGSEAFKVSNIKKIEGLANATGGLEFDIYALSGTSIETLDIPDNAILGTRAFKGCKSLKTVTIGDNLTFNPLSQISSKSLGQFEQCPALENIYIYSQELAEEHITTPDHKYPTFDMTNNPTFHVCKGSVTEQVLRNKGFITDGNVEYWSISDAFNELQKAIKSAEFLSSDKYTEESWTVLSDAIKNAKAKTENSSYSEIVSAKTAIINAIKKLESKPLGYIRNGWTSTPFLSGVTDERTAGATQIKFTFDCASDTSYNSYFDTPIQANIGGTITDFKMKGTSTSENLGEKNCTATMMLTSPVEAGQNYTFTGYTYGYPNAKDYIFAMTKVEFLDKSGNVLGEVTAKAIFQDELAKAIADAEALDTANYTTESVAELTKAIEEAKALTDEATLGEINIAEESIKTAIRNLKYLPADYTAVEEAKAKVPADLSGYTQETVDALNVALAAVVEGKNITEQAVVDGWAKAIEEAIAGLETKPIGGNVSVKILVSDENAETEMTVKAIASDGTETVATATSMDVCTIENLPVGEYTLTISGGKYVERSYGITVTEEGIFEDVKLNLLGDINGDGKVTTADVGMANSHAKGVKILEGYEFDCANVKVDKEVTTADVGMINSHAKGVKTLW